MKVKQKVAWKVALMVLKTVELKAGNWVVRTAWKRVEMGKQMVDSSVSWKGNQ